MVLRITVNPAGPPQPPPELDNSVGNPGGEGQVIRVAANDWSEFGPVNSVDNAPHAGGATAPVQKDSWAEFGPIAKTPIAGDKPEPTGTESFLRGAVSGATAETADEISGLAAASGLPEGAGWARAPVGALKLLAEDNPVIKGDTPGPRLEIAKSQALAAYEKARDEFREKQEAAKASGPWAYGGGQFAGAAATLPLTRGLGAATVPQRMLIGAKVGAGYGTLSGFGGGKGAADSAAGAAFGGVTGAALGAAIPAVTGTIGNIIAPAIRAVRIAKDPDAAALRAVVDAIAKDNPGKSGAEIINEIRSRMINASHQGQNLAVAETQGANTAGLARNAFNLSDDAKGLLERYVRGEFHGQTERTQSWLAGLIPGGKSAVQLREAADAAERAANAPAYKKAYTEGDRPLWTPEIEQLAQDPIMQSAIRRASILVRSERTRQGFVPMNSPFEFEQSTGNLIRRGSDPNGKTTYPDLMFWDLVKRELDKGDRNSQAFAKVLRDHLDTIVPSYGQARQGASGFFQAENAFDAGAAFMRSRSTPEHDIEAARHLAKMTSAQRELFAQGFSTEMKNAVGNVGDSADVLTRSFFNNPNARKRIDIALGPQRAQELEAFLHVERLKKQFHNAFGNSTTARQQYQMAGATALGLGGAEAYREGFENLDPVSIFGAALVGGAGGYASGRLRGINNKIAEQVAKLLLSNDPTVVERGLKLVTSRPGLMEKLRNATIGAVESGPQGLHPGSTLRPTFGSDQERQQQ